MAEFNKLISQLRNFDENNPDLQLQACIELGKLVRENIHNKQSVIDALIDAINCNNCAATRAEAVKALGDKAVNALGDSTKRAIDKLKDSLQDPYQLVRSYSIKSLGELNDESIIYALIKCLTNSEEYYGVRCEAVVTLAKKCPNKESSAECQAVWQAFDETLKECEEVCKDPHSSEEKKNSYERIKTEILRRHPPKVRPF